VHLNRTNISIGAYGHIDLTTNGTDINLNPYRKANYNGKEIATKEDVETISNSLNTALTKKQDVFASVSNGVARYNGSEIATKNDIVDSQPTVEFETIGTSVNIEKFDTKDKL
jgi:hypothetical protein